MSDRKNLCCESKRPGVGREEEEKTMSLRAPRGRRLRGDNVRGNFRPIMRELQAK